mgnify:CR=1 FL=1
MSIRWLRENVSTVYKSDFPFVSGCGRFIYADKFGEWRSVPGFDENELIVSSMGYMRQKCNSAELREAFIPVQSKHTGYCSVGFKGRMFLAHRLVCSAFHGDCPTGFTCDHITKYGDLLRERMDNRASNLRWADTTTQALNKSARSATMRCDTFHARHKEWPHCTPNMFFQSKNKLLKFTGLHWNRLDFDSAKETGLINVDKWIIFCTPDDDPPLEVWKDVDATLRVSSHGRAQFKKYSKWQNKFTPLVSRGHAYAVLRNKLFHRLVFLCFGGVLQAGETVDHKNGDKSDNAFNNLRAASKSTQRLNQIRVHTSRAHVKNRVMGRKLGSEEWEKFDSCLNAQKILTPRECVKFNNSAIGRVARQGSVKQHMGWEFMFY